MFDCIILMNESRENIEEFALFPFGGPLVYQFHLPTLINS